LHHQAGLVALKSKWHAIACHGMQAQVLLVMTGWLVITSW
jgi:hypothetical protein